MNGKLLDKIFNDAVVEQLKVFAHYSQLVDDGIMEELYVNDTFIYKESDTIEIDLSKFNVGFNILVSNVTYFGTDNSKDGSDLEYVPYMEIKMNGMKWFKADPKAWAKIIQYGLSTTKTFDIPVKKKIYGKHPLKDIIEYKDIINRDIDIDHYNLYQISNVYFIDGADNIGVIFKKTGEIRK